MCMVTLIINDYVIYSVASVADCTIKLVSIVHQYYTPYISYGYATQWIRHVLLRICLYMLSSIYYIWTSAVVKFKY